MTDNELKKLSRAELLKLLIDQTNEVEMLKAKIAEKDEQLRSRELKLQRAGSLAEASLALSGVFSAAQDAAEIYLENLRTVEGRAQKIVDEANVRAAEIIAKAEADSMHYWDELSEKLERLYDSHMGLREIIAVGNFIKPE